ncbi:hypothetical protein ACSMEB_09375 [Stenotrophomonas maltophilia]
MEPFDWSKVPFASTHWRGQVIPHALPILIRWAKEGEPHTYSDLAQELHDQFGHAIKPRKDLYGTVAGGVAQAIEWLSGQWETPIPPLHVIVVNKQTWHPGDGAITISPAYFDGKKWSTEEEKRAHLRQAMEDVFTYPDWNKVAEALGAKTLTPRSGAKPVDANGQSIPLPKVQQGGGPESLEHRALKRWVREHPQELIDYGLFETGANEKLVSSGDRLDVLFDNGRQRLAVEVKTSKCSESELMRGVYQCVKYRSILRAEQLALQHVPTGDAVLICPRAPGKETKALIKLLNVNFHRVPMDAESGE